MIKLIIKYIKKIIFSFLFIYSINMLLNSINIFIPINIFTIFIGAILGVPGILSLISIFFIIN